MTLVLPELARPLIRQFPALDPDEVRNETWAVANDPGLDTARCARGWIRWEARRTLITAVGEQRRDTRLWSRLLVEFGKDLASPGADAFIQEDLGRPVGHIWEDLGLLLPRLRWPEVNAGPAVAALQEVVELSEGKISINRAAAALEEVNVPDGLKRPLVRFVFDEDGYVQARLKGFSAHRTLKLPAIQSKLKTIIWKSSADREVLHPVPLHSLSSAEQLPGATAWAS